MADATTLTSKGQVTVPQAIRERMGLKPGDKMAFALLSDGTLVVRPKTRHVAGLVGLLRRPGQPIVPIDAMTVDLAADDTPA